MLGVIAFAVMACFVNLLAAFLTLLAIAFYVVVYTILLKRTTPQNIVIGGAAGALPPLIGWAAVTGDIALPALLLFAIVFYWTPPHFWALSLRLRRTTRRPACRCCRSSWACPRRRARSGCTRSSWSPSRSSCWAVAPMGSIYLGAAVGLGAMFLWQAYGCGSAARPRPTRTAGAIKLYKYSISYLSLLFAAVALDALVLDPPLGPARRWGVSRRALTRGFETGRAGRRPIPVPSRSATRRRGTWTDRPDPSPYASTRARRPRSPSR